MRYHPYNRNGERILKLAIAPHSHSGGVESMNDQSNPPVQPVILLGMHQISVSAPSEWVNPSLA